jgi:hypothetical protein
MSTIRIRRGLVAACLACAAVPAAQAVMLDQHGLGQVLVYPYYTVNRGQDTLLTLVNTAGVGKAVRVAFREAYNGRETLAFNLFLSPRDAWSGACRRSTAATPAALACCRATRAACSH